MKNRSGEMTDKFVWRVKTLDMDTPSVLVAGSGVKEVIMKGQYKVGIKMSFCA